MSSPANTPAKLTVIQGITLTSGRAFRPSDWAERLCGVMSSFDGDGQVRYSSLVRPIMLDGVRCVVVDESLKEIEPRAYRFLFDFAHDNDLTIIIPGEEIGEDFCPVPNAVLDRLARA